MLKLIRASSGSAYTVAEPVVETSGNSVICENKLVVSKSKIDSVLIFNMAFFNLLKTKSVPKPYSSIISEKVLFFLMKNDQIKLLFVNPESFTSLDLTLFFLFFKTEAIFK